MKTGTVFLLVCIALVVGGLYADLSKERRTHCEWTVYPQGPFGPTEPHSGDMTDAEIEGLKTRRDVFSMQCPA